MSNSVKRSFIKLTFQNVHKRYWAVLAYCGLILAYYFLLLTLGLMLPLSMQDNTLSLWMLGWVFWIPILNGYIIFQHHAASNQVIAFFSSFKLGFQKFLSLMAGLLAVILLPAIIVALGLSIWLALSFLKIAGYELVVFVVCGILMLIPFNTRFHALTLILTTNLDSSTCVEKCKEIIKNHKWRTFFRATLPFLLWLFLLFEPLWIKLFLLESGFTLWVNLSIHTIILILVTPYIWSSILQDLYDLNTGSPPASKAPKQKKILNHIPTKTAKPDTTNWF